MKLIFTLFLALPFLGFAQSRSIEFEQGNWNSILAKAKSGNRLIMLDAYTSWCGPCKWMAKNVFTNDTVADFYNANFVNAKIDMEKDEGPGLATKYGVSAYPTFLFIDGDGNLVHRVCGSDYPQNFIRTGRNAMTPEKTLAFAESEFRRDSKNPDIALRYINMLSHACASSGEAADKYLATVDEKSLSEAGNWRILHDHIRSSKSKAFVYMLKHQDEFGKKYTADSVSGKILSVYEQSFRNVAATKDELGFIALKKEVTQNVAGDPSQIILKGEMIYYRAQKDWAKYSDATVQYADKYAMNSASLLNELGWNFYLNVEDKAKLEKAVAWTKRSIELENQYYNNDTLAALLFKLGRKEDAKAAALKAIELGKAAGDDVKETEELLKKIETLK